MKQRSMGKKHAFRRAQSMANENGKACAVIYDTALKTYAAESLYDNDLSPIMEDITYKIIAIVNPKPCVPGRK